jgi:Protein of unknown function (DUF1659).
MAIASIPVSTSLVLVLDYGLNSAGKIQTKERVFKSLNPDSTNDNVYATSQILLGLQEKTSIAVQRRDVVELSSQ